MKQQKLKTLKNQRFLVPHFLGGKKWNVQVEDGKRNARLDGSGKEKDLNELRRKESKEEESSSNWNSIILINIINISIISIYYIFLNI